MTAPTQGERKTKSAFSQFMKKWQPLIILIAAGLWTVITAAATTYWTVYKFEATRSDEAIQRQNALEKSERDAAITRKIEAQKPFLEQRLKLYFEAIQVAGRLTEWELAPDSKAWKDNAKRFWELRWSELEMVGDNGIRQAARRVGQQITEIEFDSKRDRHDLRWMVTCNPNRIVAPIHPKAMPVILTRKDEIETWLTADWKEAKSLQRPLPDDGLTIVTRGETTTEQGRLFG